MCVYTKHGAEKLTDAAVNVARFGVKLIISHKRLRYVWDQYYVCTCVTDTHSYRCHYIFMHTYCLYASKEFRFGVCEELTVRKGCLVFFSTLLSVSV